MDSYTIWTDGAAKGNPGPSGWCWWAGPECWAAGGWSTATNNIAELTAVGAALAALQGDLNTNVTIVTDSKYVINSMTKYIHGWKRNGWRTTKGDNVANIAYIKRIDELIRARNATLNWEWVKGHTGVYGNTHADAGASQAAEAFAGRGTLRTGPGWTGTLPQLPS